MGFDTFRATFTNQQGTRAIRATKVLLIALEMLDLTKRSAIDSDSNQGSSYEENAKLTSAASCDPRSAEQNTDSYFQNRQ